MEVTSTFTQILNLKMKCEWNQVVRTQPECVSCRFYRGGVQLWEAVGDPSRTERDFVRSRRLPGSVRGQPHHRWVSGVSFQELTVRCLFTSTIFTLIVIDKCCVVSRRGHQAGVRRAGCCRQEAVVHQRPGCDSGWKEGVLHRLQQQVGAQKLPAPHHGGHGRRTVRQEISSAPSRSESSRAFTGSGWWYLIL